MRIGPNFMGRPGFLRITLPAGTATRTGEGKTDGICDGTLRSFDGTFSAFSPGFGRFKPR
jgi:hypothetical protein